MKPPPFAYTDPHSMEEALDALAQWGDEAKVLAGGQSLMPLLNMRLAHPWILIDLNRISSLAYLLERRQEDTPGVSIGAMTRQRVVERGGSGGIVPPLLHEAIGWVGHVQIRNRGTVGGSIAHADPAAELPLVLRALDGAVTVRSSRGVRTIHASDFFMYTFTTAIEPDELLVDVWLPLPSPRTGQSFLEVARRHGDFALVAIAVSLTLHEAGTCAEARVALGGAAPVPIRATQVETALKGQAMSADLCREAAALAIQEMEPVTDMHADSTYRREVASTLTYRALLKAWERALPPLAGAHA